MSVNVIALPEELEECVEENYPEFGLEEFTVGIKHTIKKEKVGKSKM